jgi:hypothetical protein
VVFDRALGEFTALEELSDHIETHHICLALFHRRGMLAQGGTHRAAAVERVFHTQSVRDFVEHRVPEKRVECDIGALVLRNEFRCQGLHDLIELRLHRVLELQPSRAPRQLDLLVIREVDGDGLRASVRVAGVVHDVVRIQVGVRARHFCFITCVHGQAPLQAGQQRREPRQAFAPGLVFNEHIPLVSRLIAEQLVLVVLDGPDHDIDRVVLHVHPGDVTRLVFVGLERICAQTQVVRQPRVACQLGCFPELRSRRSMLFRELLMVRHGNQRPCCVSPHEGVEAP